MNVIAFALAFAAAGLILWRAACVVNDLHRPLHPRPGWHFLGLGLSYVTLGVSGVAGALSLLGWPPHEAPLLGLLAASAGLILFDRRRRPRKNWHGMTVDTLHHPQE